MSWEPPFEDEIARGTMDALFEMNVKLADIRAHLAVIRVLLGEDIDGEEEEESH
jgi:fructose-1,6-bisphosphatase/inositol monophosphatase family enzyme